MKVTANFASALNKPMKRLFICCGAAVVLLMSGTAHGQQPGDSWQGDAKREWFERLREDGCAALYNIDYATARADFSELVRLFRQHPAGPQYLTTAPLVKTRATLAVIVLQHILLLLLEGRRQADPNVGEHWQALTGEAQASRDAAKAVPERDTRRLLPREHSSVEGLIRGDAEAPVLGGPQSRKN